MFMIVDHESHRIVGYPDGSLYYDVSYDNIRDYAKAIASINDGAFIIERAGNPDFDGYPIRKAMRNNRISLEK